MRRAGGRNAPPSHQWDPAEPGSEARWQVRSGPAIPPPASTREALARKVLEAVADGWNDPQTPGAMRHDAELYGSSLRNEWRLGGGLFGERPHLEVATPEGRAAIVDRLGEVDEKGRPLHELRVRSHRGFERRGKVLWDTRDHRRLQSVDAVIDWGTKTGLLPSPTRRGVEPVDSRSAPLPDVALRLLERMDESSRTGGTTFTAQLWPIPRRRELDPTLDTDEGRRRFVAALQSRDADGKPTHRMSLDSTLMRPGGTATFQRGWFLEVRTLEELVQVGRDHGLVV